MTFNPDIHHRRSIRLKEYDYTKAGAYFVTICLFQRECLCGCVIDGEMQLGESGLAVQDAWDDLPNHYSHVELDQFIVMPNHVHGIVLLDNSERESERHGLSEIVRAFKTFSAKRINKLRDNPGCSVWQRNFYERVIRTEQELSKAREYIVNNPLKWDLDRENPINSA